ncbi:MAG: hypothetical protein ACLVJZ_12785, partial [[Clostridium] leptum]
ESSKYDDSRFGVAPFSFLHCDFLIFISGCPILMNEKSLKSGLIFKVYSIEKEAEFGLPHF